MPWNDTDRAFFQTEGHIAHRLLARVGKPDANGCWPWLGGKRSNGYGTFAVRVGDDWTQTTAHRAAYELFKCDVPVGWEVDHLCCNRGCVNPEHLEAVTLQENRRRRNARKTHCVNGHEYTSENTYWWTTRDGYRNRYCQICRKLALEKRKK